MGLNLSNEQIAQELDLDKDVYQMTSQLRTGIVAGKPEVTCAGVECDEVYVTAEDIKAEAVKKKGGRQGGETVSKGFRAGHP